MREFAHLDRSVAYHRLDCRSLGFGRYVGFSPSALGCRRYSVRDLVDSAPVVSGGIASVVSDFGSRVSLFCKLRCEFSDHDADRIFDTKEIDTKGPEICISGPVIKGVKKPHDCPAFGKQCTPEHPLGATVVSAEGACAAYYAYGRHLENQKQSTALVGA